jgi:hypothetical protein
LKVNILKKYFKGVILPSVIYIVILFVFGLININWGEEILLIITYLYLMYIMTILMIPGIFKEITIYSWMDENSHGDNFLRENLMIRTHKDLLSNLEIIKKELIHYTNSDQNKLKLLRANFKSLQNESIEQNYYKIILGFIILIVINFLTRNTDLFVNFGFDLANIILIFSLFWFFLIFVISFLKHQHSGKRRITLVYEILDELIED